MEITVGDQQQEFSAYIEGEDTIKLNRSCSYKLIGTTNINQIEVIMEIQMQYSQEEIDKEIILDPKDYAAISYDKDNEVFVIHANNKNKLHALKLVATYNGEEYTKLIKIVPLW